MIPIRDVSGRWREPTLDEILSDPIAEAVMRADSVDRAALDAMLHHVTQDLQARRLAQFAAGRHDGQKASMISPRYGA